MVRRSLGVALWMIVGLLACFLGALSALVGTGAGRALLARVMESALTQVFTGSIEVGDVRGSLLTGVTLTGVRLFDADTTLVALLPRADLAYNPLDFAAGRVVLFEFALRQPVINIVQLKNGRLNIEELLRLGGPDTGSGPHGPAAGGPRRPAAGGRGLPRGGPVAGPLPPVPAADGAGTGLLAARHAVVRPLAARRLGDAERLSLHRQAVRARRRAGGRSPAQVARRAGARGRAQSAAAQPGRRHGDRPPHGAVRRRLGARGAARRRAGRAGLRPRRSEE